MSAPGLRADFVRVPCHVAEVPQEDIVTSEVGGKAGGALGHERRKFGGHPSGGRDWLRGIDRNR